MNSLWQLASLFQVRPSLRGAARLVIPLFCASLLFMAPLLFAPRTVAEAWQPLGLRGQTVLGLAVVTSDDRQIVYAETTTGLWRYLSGEDGSPAGWQNIDAGLPHNGLGGPALAAWRVVPGRSLELYAVTGVGDLRQLYHTHDGGDSWQSVGPAPGQTARPAMAVVAGAQNSTDLIALATNTRMQRSADGGAAWSPGGLWSEDAAKVAPGREQDSGVNVLLADSQDAERLFALTKHGQLWASDSGGLAWRDAEPGGEAVSAVALAPQSGMKVWAATESGLARSVDGGASWTLLVQPGSETQARNPGGLIAGLAPDPAVAETVYASLKGGTVYRSDDDGASWTFLGAPGATRVTALALDANARNTLYAATEDGVWVRSVVALQPTATPVPSETPTSVPADTPTPEPTAAPSITPTASPTLTLTLAPIASLTASPTDTAIPTATASATATRRPTPRFPSRTPSPTLTRALAPATMLPGQGVPDVPGDRPPAGPPTTAPNQTPNPR